MSLYEDHVLYHTNTEFHLTLKKKFNDTSFQNFSSLILDMAREKTHGFGACRESIQLNCSTDFSKEFLVLQSVPHYSENSVEKSVEIQLNRPPAFPPWEGT